MTHSCRDYYNVSQQISQKHHDLNLNFGRDKSKRIASKREIKITIPETIAEKVTSTFR